VVAEKVQRLTGCMAALRRFISRLGKKGMPFYKLLKKVDHRSTGSSRGTEEVLGHYTSTQATTPR
jgi:hypothetical protein